MAAPVSNVEGLIGELGHPVPGAGGRVERDWRPLVLLVLGAGAIYGAFMGSFDPRWDRALLLLYAGIKVPILVLATTLVCLPGFFALNTVLGLRDDFGKAMRAVLAGQAALALALASLAPVTLLAYISGISHTGALLFNALMFTIATAVAQVVVLRRYRPLIAARPAHALMLWTWVALYAFVGIQMGWMLRPFVGNPGLEVAFFRPEPFSNAYVFLIDLVFRR